MKNIVLLTIATLVLSGCALLQSPTPRTNAKVTNYSLTTDTRRDGRVREVNSPATAIELPEVWTAGNVKLTSIEQWQKVGPEFTGAYEAPLLRREVQIERVTDPSIAGDVAAIRAARTAEVSGEIGTALLSATAMSLLRYMESMDVRQSERTERERIAVDRRILELEERLRQAEEAARHEPAPEPVPVEPTP
jgi:uncharacterized protein YceK